MRKLYWSDSASRVLIVQKLLSEKIVVRSSDTVLGLLSVVSERGASLLNEMKLLKDKPFIILIESASNFPGYFQPAPILPGSQFLAERRILIQASWNERVQ